MQVKPLILAVDDECDVTELLRRVLGQGGYEVITANDGSQALDIVAQRKPHLVILDIKMPGKSGMEVLQEIRTSYPDTAVVMATAVFDINVAIKALTDGAYGYLNKPFNVNELILIVERALERRRILVENREYRLNLEMKVNEQTQTLQQKVRELTALNNLFSRYLNESFESADKYVRLAGEIMEAGESMRNSAADNCVADSITRLAKEIQALAKGSQAVRVGLSASTGDKRTT